MVGRPRKPPNAIAGHRAKVPRLPAASSSATAPALPAPGQSDDGDGIPAYPRGILKHSREIWVRFWRSELAGKVDRQGGMYRVERWIRYVDELERAWRLYRQARFVPGSMGQTRVNTVWRVIQDCEANIVKAEDQLGMTPLARARLGLTIGEAALTVDELNRRMNQPDEPMGPRLVNPDAIEGEFQPL